MRQENKMTIEQYMDELKIEKKDHNIIFEYPIPEELKRFLKKYEDTELPFGEIIA